MKECQEINEVWLNEKKVMNMENGQSGELSQHQLVTRLLEGVVLEVRDAEKELKKSASGLESEEKEYVMRAISIIDALRSGLDLDVGGELAENLYSLYEYMERRLAEGYQSSSVEMVSEVGHLLDEVLAGWKVIPDEEPQEVLQKVAIA